MSMENIKKMQASLASIIELARKSSGKKYSELSELERHAVSFCGYIKPFRQDSKNPLKLKVVAAKDKDAYESVGSAIGGAQMKLKSLITQYNLENKNLATTFYVIIDQKLDEFLTASVEDALANYPKVLYVHEKALEDFTNGMPPIVPTDTSETFSLADELSILLNELLYRVARKKKLTAAQIYTIYILQEFPSAVIDLRKALPYFPRGVDTEWQDYGIEPDNGKYTLENLTQHFKTPIVNAVYWALKGKHPNINDL